MKITICSVVLLAASFLWAQSGPSSSRQVANNNREGSVTVRGCVKN
jgi:hypothetical protein